MTGRTLLLLVAAAGLAPAQATRERGRFSLQGDGATLMAVDAETKFAAIAFSKGTLCVFPADQRIVNLYSFPVHSKTVTGMVFFPEAKQFATSSTDGTLRLWRTDDARKHHKAMEDKNGEAKLDPPKPVISVSAHAGYAVTCLAISPDGQQLATGSSDGAVKIWEAATLKQLASIPGAHAGGVRSVQFSPVGQSLASGGVDKIAKIWDTSKAKPEVAHKLEGHENVVFAVAFSPDGKLLAAGTGLVKKAGTVHIWDVATGKREYKLEGHEDVVTCLVFHPKTAHLATGSADKKIRIWNLKDKTTEYIDEHAEPLRNLVVTPDGVRFGSCSERAVRWWAGFGK